MRTLEDRLENYQKDWKWLKANNIYSCDFIGNTPEEFKILISLIPLKVLWAPYIHGPAGPGAICIADVNPYAGAYPLMALNHDDRTMGCNGEDQRLICAEHNKSIVKLHLALNL